MIWALLHLAGTALGAGVAHRHPGSFFLPTWFSLLLLTRISAGMVLGLALLPGRRGVCLWSGVFLLALLAGWSEAEERLNRQGAWAPDPVGPATVGEYPGAGFFRVTSWPGPSRGDRWQAAAVLLGWRAAESGFREAGPVPLDGVMLTGPGKPPLPNQVLAGLAVLKVPASGDLPGSFDYREFLAGRHLRWRGKLEKTQDLGPAGEAGSLVTRFLVPARRWILSNLRELFPSREAELAGAVLLGSRSAGSRQGALPFADLGLAHLFAVSGLHVGILLGIVILPGRMLGLSATGRFLPLLLFLPFYAVLTGLPGSVIRASGLAILAGGAGALGRRGNSLHQLGLLFWGSTFMEPVQVLDTGVRLSYLAAGGIIAVMGQLRDLTGKAKPGAWILAALAVSLAAQWFTLPQAALSFGRFSSLATVANLVAVPLFGLGVWAVVTALLVNGLWSWLAQSVAAWGWLVLRGLSGVVALVSRGTGGMNAHLAPTTPWLGFAWALLSLTGLALLVRTAKSQGSSRPRGWGVLLGILLVGHGLFAWSGYRLVANGVMKVWQFDVGQGDCALVVFPDRWTCLIDTGGVFGLRQIRPEGPVSRTVAPFLERGWLRRLNAVVLGHGHLDHTGGAAFLEESFSVDRWWAGGDAARDISEVVPADKITTVNQGEILHRQGPWCLEILPPGSSRPPDFHENDQSLVLVLRHHDRACMVWSGDLEEAGESHLLATGKLPDKVQVWKAGHHGSNTSGSRAWVEKIDPDLVLISCGVGNKYGHPNHGWYTVGLDTLPVLRTDLEGSILLEWDPAGELEWRTRAREGHLAAIP